MAKAPKIKVIWKDSSEVAKDCAAWAQDIRQVFQPDAIVFLEKSGWIFAKPLAEALNCLVYSLRVSRPGNDVKDDIKKKVPWVPKFALALVLSSKAMYGYNEENSEREVTEDACFDKEALSKCKNILVVDDSVDTGWSVLAAKNRIQEVAPEANVKIASYCVIDCSLSRVSVDFQRYRNTIVMSATSRYSKEHQAFLNDLTKWKSSRG